MLFYKDLDSQITTWESEKVDTQIFLKNFASFLSALDLLKPNNVTEQNKAIWSTPLSISIPFIVFWYLEKKMT